MKELCNHDQHTGCSCCQGESIEHELECDCPLCQKMDSILLAFNKSRERASVQQPEDE